LKETSAGCIKALSWHLPGWTEKNYEKSSKYENLFKFNRWPTPKFETIFPRKIFRNLPAMYPVRPIAVSMHKHHLSQTNRGHRNKALCLHEIGIILEEFISFTLRPHCPLLGID